jgi:aspartate kinase
MITTSEVAVSVTVDNDGALQEIVRELQVFSIVEVNSNQTIVSIVGNEIAADAGVLTNVFDSLQSTKVTMVSYGGSAHNISVLVPGDQKKHVLQQLNKGLFNL